MADADGGAGDPARGGDGDGGHDDARPVSPALGDRRRGGPHQPDAIPFEISKPDALRLKLREHLRQTNRMGAVQLPSLPGIQSLSIATRYIEGGRKRFLEFMQLAVLNEMPHAIKWWAVFADLLPGERTRVSYDDVCAAAGVQPSALMSEVVSCAMEYTVDVGNLVAASLHPHVVKAAGTSAKRIDGEHAQVALEDRRMLFQHQNFIPIPKGASVHVHANATANAQAAAAATAEPSVPSFADDMQALGPSRQRVQQQLIEGSAPSVQEELTTPATTPAAREAELVER